MTSSLLTTASLFNRPHSIEIAVKDEYCMMSKVRMCCLGWKNVVHLIGYKLSGKQHCTGWGQDGRTLCRHFLSSSPLALGEPHGGPELSSAVPLLELNSSDSCHLLPSPRSKQRQHLSPQLISVSCWEAGILFQPMEGLINNIIKKKKRDELLMVEFPCQGRPSEASHHTVHA